MGLLTTKRVASLLAAGASVLALGGLSGTASAACVDIEGTGATFQAVAHTSVWIPLFPCTGTSVTTYTGIGSGPGMNRWKADGSAGAPSGDEFIATDDPPTPAQINAIKAAAGGSSVEVFPVVQAAVAVIVRPPANCTPTANPLVADANAVVEAYESGTADFTEIFPGQVTGAGCTTNARPYARSSASGTTLIFKQYLDAVGGFSGPVNSSTTWPAGGTVSATAVGGPRMVTSVDGTPGSIGYVVLADAVAGGLSPDSSASAFWVELPNGTASADPAVADGINPPTSNCANASYGTFPADATDADWTGVSGVDPGATDYPICSLSYVIAYSARYTGAPSVSGRTFSADQGETVCRYLSYVTDDAPGEGQTLIDSFHYLALPAGARSIQTVAEAGANSVNGGC